MDFPETLRDIVKDCASKHPKDVGAAVRCAVNKWKRCEDYGEWIEAMVEGQIRSMIHDARHHTMVAIRKQAGEYGGPHKVGLDTGIANRIAAQSLLDTYSIGGVALGDVLGEQLPEFAKSEHAKAIGCEVNARLCNALAPLVEDKKAVRECVTEKKVWQILRDIRRQPKLQAARLQKKQRKTAMALAGA